MKIRRLKYDEIGLLKDFSPPDWHFDLVNFMKMHFDEPYFIPLIADISNNVAGVGNGIITGETGWIGNIIVKEEFRRKGIATAITREVISKMREMKCRSFLLIATQEGFPLYRKLGFRNVANYCFFQTKNIHSQAIHPCIRPFMNSDFHSLLQFDFEATGEKREFLLRKVVDGGSVFHDEVVKGFYLPGFGQGYIVAKSVEAGSELLSFKMRKASGTLVVPEQNFDAIGYLEKSGFHEKSIAPRMLLGEEMVWNPAMIWSRAAGYCG